jgi:molybdopterin-guanine dinucleotide biosynthesis protein A
MRLPRPDDLAPLLLHTDRLGAAFEGYHLPAVIDPALLPSDARAHWPLGLLMSRCGVRRLSPPREAEARLRGANTPAERDALLEELAAYEAWASADAGPP